MSGGDSSKGTLLVQCQNVNQRKTTRLMESEELLPIQTPLMVVKDHTTGVRSVLSHPDRHTAAVVVTFLSKV